jgi:hypothetical protein
MFKSLRHGLLLLLAAAVIAGCGGAQELTPYQKAQQTALDTIKPGRFDNGRMWTFDYPPVKYFQEQYNFSPDQQWMDDVRMSALRFATYCSASFVSGDGLVMTNHHCGREPVEQVSKPGENLTDKGYVARTLADERKVEGLFVSQLTRITDVTAEINGAMDAEKTDKDKLAKRDAKIEEIEKRFTDEKANLSCEVVTFFNGGKYSAYVYKRYTDVRLVFSPEIQLGFFGGDDDNFTYPRYTLDCNFFRVYGDDGKPLKTEHFYKWSANGAKEGELVFTVGNPGSTGRLSTTEQLEFNRDVQFPWISGMLDDYVDVLQQYMALHPEKKDEMLNQYFQMTNSQKSYKGQLDGLRNPVLLQRRRAFDAEFRGKVQQDSKLNEQYGQLWAQIAENRNKVRAVSPDLLGLRFEVLGGSEYLNQALSLARLTTELGKPEADRAKAYKENALKLTIKTMKKYKSPDMDMERLSLTKKLAMMKRFLPADDPIVKVALQGQSPEEAAKRLLATTVLRDSVKFVAFAEGIPESVEKSDDPLITIARMAVPRRDAAQKVAMEVSAQDEVNKTLLGRALFDVYGTTIPPDATFTLRISDGVVQGYEYNGTKAPSHTTFYGMYDRYYSNPGDKQWDLPEQWRTPPPEMNLGTPFNFVSTNDIIGGNSGSPLINRNKEIIGLAFDGNMESLPGEFIFAPEFGNRTVSVHSAGMIEAISKIYKLERLEKELRTGKIVE